MCDVAFPDASRAPAANGMMMASCGVSRWRTVLVAAVLLASAGSARAGLFDDDEARRAVLDLRNRIAQLEEARRTSDSQITQALQQVQNALLDLNNQNEQLRLQIAQLRGTSEQLGRDVADVQRRQKDIAQGVEDRLKKVEPQRVELDGKQFTADPDEVRMYEEATATLRGGEFEKAVQSLTSFMRRYPTSGYSDTARYWLANAQYGSRDFKNAMQTFRAFIAAAPTHPRASEALLAVANCQIELKDLRTAKKTLDDLLKTYPKSEAAVAGRERLATLK